ncbi:MAG: hypothetical protein Q9187_005942, partial [Circinaria calcarea]
GTPNSGTTSLSALSTTAIKDGHQGHHPPHAHHHTSSSASTSSTNTLDAERADRISRLAGLERVATIRQGAQGPTSQLTPGGSTVNHSAPQSYFDNAGTIQGNKMSTVGSASATGSVGGRTTWASGSDVYDADKMSEDQDDGVSSSAGLSDEGNASLVGFGEGASSTISGPVSTSGRMNAATGGRINSSMGSSSVAKGGYQSMDGGSPMQGVQTEKSRMTGQETAERILRDRLNEGGVPGRRTLESLDEARGLHNIQRLSKVYPAMLGPFRIRNLRRPASPPNRQSPGSVPAKVGAFEAVVCLTGQEYQTNALNRPESRLRYLDEDDGETVTVGTSTELSCRLSEPVPRYARSNASTGPKHPDLSSNTVNPPVSPTMPDMHVFEIDRRGESVRIWEEIEQRTVQLKQKSKNQEAIAMSDSTSLNQCSVNPTHKSERRPPVYGDDDLSVQVDPSDDACRLQEMQSDDIHHLQKAQLEKGLLSEGQITLSDKQREDVRKLQFIASNPPQVLTSMMTGEESKDVTRSRYAPFEVEEETLAKEDTPLLSSFHEGNLTTEGKRQAIIAGIQLRARNNPIHSQKNLAKELRSDSHEKNRWATYVGSKPFSMENPVAVPKPSPSHVDKATNSKDQQNSLLEVFQAELAKISRPSTGVTEQQGISSDIEVPPQTREPCQSAGTATSALEPLSEGETRQQLVDSMVVLIDGINSVASGLRNQVIDIQGKQGSEIDAEAPQNVLNSQILGFAWSMREAAKLCQRRVDSVHAAVGKSGELDLQNFRETVRSLDVIARNISTMGSHMSSVTIRDTKEAGNRRGPQISPSPEKEPEESRWENPDKVEAHVAPVTSACADHNRETLQSPVNQEAIAKEIQELEETAEKEKLWTMEPNPYEPRHAESTRNSELASIFTALPNFTNHETPQSKKALRQSLSPSVKFPSVRFADSPTIPTKLNHGPSTLPLGKAYRNESTITYRHIPSPMPHEPVDSYRGRQSSRVSSPKPYYNQRGTHVDYATTFNSPELKKRKSMPTLEYRRGSRSRSRSPNVTGPQDAFRSPQLTSFSTKATFPQGWGSTASTPSQSEDVDENSRSYAMNAQIFKRASLVEHDTIHKKHNSFAFDRSDQNPTIQESSNLDFIDPLRRSPNTSVSEQELLDHMENPSIGRLGHLGPSLRRWRSYHPNINEGLRNHPTQFPGPLYVPRKQLVSPAESAGLRHSFSMSAIRKPRPSVRMQSAVPNVMTAQESMSISNDSRAMFDRSAYQSRALIEEESKNSQHKVDAPVSPLVATRFPTLEQFEGSRRVNIPSFPPLPSMEPLVPLRSISSKVPMKESKIIEPSSNFTRVSNPTLPKAYDNAWPQRATGPDTTESSGDFFRRMTGIGEPLKKPITPVSPVQLGPAAPGARLVGPFDPLAETAAIHRHQLIEGVHRSNTVATSSDKWTTRNRRPYSDCFSGNGRIGWDHFVGGNQRGPSDWASARERERVSRMARDRGRPSRVQAASMARPAHIAVDREEAFAPAHQDPTTVSKVQSCVEQLKDLGFGRAEDGGLGRLVVYAQAANGDLEDAIDMIDEERKAYEGRGRN